MTSSVPRGPSSDGQTSSGSQTSPSGQAPWLLADRSVAVVHEWFGATGGSEQVFLEMAAMMPQSRPFVLWADKDADIGGLSVQASWLSRTPLRRNKALALPFMPLAWRTLTRDRFDVVVSSSHAFAHTVRVPSDADTRYLSYVHSPARYVWSPELDGRGARAAWRPVRNLFKSIDVRFGRHVHAFAANSTEVRRRIQRYWHRDAKVINPPVDVDFFRPGVLCNRDYLLGVGRWVTYKRFDLMIEVARLAGLPLVVAGSGPEEARLRALAARRDAVRFEVRPSRERLRELYQGALGLLYPAHEDFGMIPVEAQACGTPVLGLARGGLRETVVADQTGFLVDSLDPAAYARLVPMLSRLDPAEIRSRGEHFSIARFRERLGQWLSVAGRG